MEDFLPSSDWAKEELGDKWMREGLLLEYMDVLLFGCVRRERERERGSLYE